MSDANKHYSGRRNVRKSTSKRRILNIRKTGTTNKQNSLATSIVPISERTVIGAERNSPSTESTSSDLTFNSENDDPSKTDRSLTDFSDIIRSEADGSEEIINDGDAEELSKLRCASVCTEVIAEREKNRRQRCADYPGFAFGFSVFSSDTLMKFSVIRNELHNIMKSQLKRTESEVASLTERIRTFEKRLEESEEQLFTTSCTLAEASQKASECEKFQQEIESTDDMENNRVSIIENHLSKARFIAEQADRSQLVSSRKKLRYIYFK